MNTLQYKEETSFTIPTNISDLSSLNTPVTQHEGTNTHSEVQPHAWKDKIYRKVMDETTLRIYFPRHVDTVDTLSKIQTHAVLPMSLEYPHPDTALSQSKATVLLGQLRFLFAHSPSLYTMIS